MAGTGDTSIKTYNFFLSSAVTNAAYDLPNPVLFVDTPSGVNFLSNTLIFANDGAGELFFSFDGTTDHGSMPVGAPILPQPFRRAKRIWFRRGAGNTTIRFWAY